MQEQEKRAVLPGLPQMKEKPREVVTNPTKQLALEELPTVEKMEIFTRELSSVYVASWLPPDEFILSEIIPEIKISANINDIPKAPPKPKKSAKEEKQVKKDKYVIPEVPKPKDMQSEMELALSQVQVSMVQEAVPKPQLDVNITDEVPVVEAEKKPETNVFETLNSIQADSPPEEEKHDKVDTSGAKLIMKVDNTEVKLVQNEGKDPSYIIGKKLSNEDEYKQFIQTISGKILALDCKRLEINDNVYVHQGNGIYKDKENKKYSVDDMLNLLHT